MSHRIAVWGAVLVFSLNLSATAADAPPKHGDTLKVAVVQFRSTPDLDSNLDRHADYLRLCARNGARVVVFPECSVTGYRKDVIPDGMASRLGDAEARLAAAAKEAKVYALVGMPTSVDGTIFNSVVVIAPDGRVIERYHKIHLAGEKWAAPGDHMSVFPIDGVLCSIIICHDERYPELVRLPVLAGSRLVFYISNESGIENERKIGPYRAQAQARAVENTVFLVHANAPAEKEQRGGSHGQSRIIEPDGNITCEASIFEEEILYATLDLGDATGNTAKRSLEFEPLRPSLEQGIAQVRRITP